MIKMEQKRQRAMQAARYHFSCLRPKIYREKQEEKPHAKACPCKACKATVALIAELRESK
jgi:hypothetical protein